MLAEKRSTASDGAWMGKIEMFTPEYAASILRPIKAAISMSIFVEHT